MRLYDCSLLSDGAVALIELEEGPRLLSNVIGISPEEIACEMPVRVVYEDMTETATLPKFTPLGVADGQTG